MIGKPSGTFRWSNNALFSGYIVVVVVPPSGSQGRATQFLGRGFSSPTSGRIVIPVTDGIPDKACGVWLSSYLGPPNSRYAWYAVDKNLNTIAGPSSIFTVTEASFTLPSLTLTVPSTSNTIPEL